MNKEVEWKGQPGESLSNLGQIQIRFWARVRTRVKGRAEVHRKSMWP